MKYAPVGVGVETVPTGEGVGEPAEAARVGFDVARSKEKMSGSASLRERNGLHARSTRSNPAAAINTYLLGIIN